MIGKESKKGMKIMHCEGGIGKLCTSTAQDGWHGAKRRAMNPTSSKGYRCTVCGIEHTPKEEAATIAKSDGKAGGGKGKSTTKSDAAKGGSGASTSKKK